MNTEKYPPVYLEEHVKQQLHEEKQGIESYSEAIERVLAEKRERDERSN